MRKSAKTLLLAVALTSGLVVANPAPASAAAGYTPEAACTETAGYSGWSLARDGKRTVKTGFGDVLGHVYLMWNGRKGTNCVALIKKGFAGHKTYAKATLRIQGGGSATDAGQFKYYAAVVLKARGKCVSYYGETHDTRVDRGIATGGRSAFANCG